jgi:tRNA nucleotidyltransferase (CCA-adding enzyme)
VRILLTHEQADFDALASLLGAWLLDESALAILPNRMNRNVRAFLNLYGTELPFIERRDLPPEPVEIVTLVDTQSMVSIRGVGASTPVRVIDHHTRRPNLPKHWIVTTEDIGAATTLLVEAFRDQDAGLSMTQATLLLLGIYEDTGSLTYTRTTSRDLQAAAYLLDEGANLSVAVDFLNHPLSLEQQAVYEQLRANIRSHTIHGHTVLITCGDAGELDEELSTIAHKLRDLLEPDALFTLVKTKSGVQFIARSTSDHIDVSEIAAHFGGGGHERASAGLIKERTLEEVYTELEKILPDHVRPAITVAQIMSHGPQLIAADTPVEEIARKMQQYGYEGYPVIQDGKLVGLVNRRAVDRAMAHQLHLKAVSLMEAGTVTVQLEDSIEHLQRVMTETGWGQIPVVESETGDILGIVTRTDLLKILAPESRLPGRLNLAERLEFAIPNAHLALLKSVAEVAYDLHLPVYVVGGFVRDLILERPSLDFDIVVEGDAITLARALVQRFGGRLTSHGRFGTAKWFLREAKIDGMDLYSETTKDIPPMGSSNARKLTNRVQIPYPEFLDLISARTEFYTHPTALPTVERSSIKLDLHRRDFTINTLALRLDGHHYGELYDYWGGLDDLRKGRIRVLHSISFVDDPTRMLRAVRFEQRFGFRIEERTLQLLREALPLMNRISGDRIRHELDHILDEEEVVRMLARLDALRLLEAIHPDLNWDRWLEQKITCLQLHPEPPLEWGLSSHRGRLTIWRMMVYALWFIRLMPESARSVMDRLKLATFVREEILQACKLWQLLPTLAKNMPIMSHSQDASEQVLTKQTIYKTPNQLSVSAIVNQLEGLSALALYATYLATEDSQIRQILYTYVSRWQNLRPSTTGDDLRARGVPPGPIYARILTALRNAWLDEDISSVDQESELLEKLLMDYSSHQADEQSPKLDDRI